MTMIFCPECKKQFSHTAAACPNCGFQPTGSQRRKLKQQAEQGLVFAWIVVGGICLFVFLMCSGVFSGPEKTKSAKEQRTERIEKHFSAWDGAHINLQKAIKESLRDPDSYEHISTKYKDNGESLLVETKYRAKNGFGGMNSGRVVALVDLDGNVLEIVTQEDNL